MGDDEIWDFNNETDHFIACGSAEEHYEPNETGVFRESELLTDQSLVDEKVNLLRDEDETCSICLQKIEDPCILLSACTKGNTGISSCEHVFCFLCILQWSQVVLKPSCPLCKKPFASLLHDVGSVHQFKIFNLDEEQKRPIVAAAMSVVSSDGQTMPTPSLPPPSTNDNVATISRSTSSTSRFKRRRYSWGNSSSSDSSSNLYVGIERRKRVYQKGLIPVLGPVITNNSKHVDSSSKRLSRTTHSALQRRPNSHALVSMEEWNVKVQEWVARDLSAIIGEDADISVLICFVRRLLTDPNETRETVIEKLKPFLMEKAGQFVQEIYCFLQSNLNIFGYDSKVKYTDVKEKIRLELASENKKLKKENTSMQISDS